MDRREFGATTAALAASAAGVPRRAKRDKAAELAGFGQRLTEARQAAGLSLAECSQRLGVDPDAWQSWESGQAAPALDVGVAAAELLGVEPRWLGLGRLRA